MSIYFVQAGEGGRIKIGYSPRPDLRIAHLQTFSGPDLLILAVMGGPRSLENRLHQHLSAHRHHGEWFEPSVEVLEIARRAAIYAPELRDYDIIRTEPFTDEELDRHIAAGGIIERAARDVRQFPYCLTFSVLEALLHLCAGAPRDG